MSEINHIKCLRNLFSVGFHYAIFLNNSPWNMLNAEFLDHISSLFYEPFRYLFAFNKFREQLSGPFIAITEPIIQNINESFRHFDIKVICRKIPVAFNACITVHFSFKSDITHAFFILIYRVGRSAEDWRGRWGVRWIRA